MSTSPTAQVLAQWDEWSARCTDRLFDLDARVTAQGTDDDKLDIAAVFVARKAVVERIEAMRAASASGRDGAAAATALAADPVVDEHGGPVAADLSSAATLIDAILSRIEQRLDAHDEREGELVAALTRLAADLVEAERLSAALETDVKLVADLRARKEVAGRDAAAVTALARDVADATARLRTSDAERTRLLSALEGAEPRIEELRIREETVRALVAEVRAKVHPAPKVAVPDVDALGSVPAFDGLPWPAARALLAPWIARLDRLPLAFDEVERQHRAALDRRNDLRGLLQAYRDKAGARRLAEDPALERAYGAARDVLWSAPCATDDAEPLVSAYCEAVNEAIAALARTATDTEHGRPATVAEDRDDDGNGTRKSETSGDRHDDTQEDAR